MPLPRQVKRQIEAALRAGHEATALAALQPHLAAGGAQAHADAGFLFADLGRRDEALASYDRAIALDPACAAAWVGRGKLRADTEDYAAAHLDLDRALALLPEDAMTWFLKSALLDAQGRTAEARACLARARALDPGLFGA